ncbi:MAG: hypothetical protein J5988_02835 [Eubacterium sp.]|nr:hypothetical protein [Eubacterium sp.]
MKKKFLSPNMIYLIIAILFIYQMVLLGILISSYDTVSTGMIVTAVFFLIIGIAIDCIVFYVCRNIQKKLEMDEKLKELYRYREQETNLYKNIQAQMEQLREQRHEFANQIQTAYIMIEQDAPQEMLEKYLADLEKSYETN